MKKIIIVLSIIIGLFGIVANAQDNFPEPMEPPRLVNDFTGFLNQNEQMNLEQKLRTYNNQTSTQIYIVVVESLDGYDPNDYAVRLGEKWGMGQKGKDNGLLILIKPKTAGSKGEVYIAPGYGLEASVTDIAAKRIVSNGIIPHFKKGENYKGLDLAVNTIIQITQGEFTSEQFVSANPERKKTRGSRLFGIISFLLFFIIMGRSRGSKHSSVGRSLPFWLLLGMMGSGHSRGSGFGDFSSGSGGFGGFGGGGGGSFGGGGAGGSW